MDVSKAPIDGLLIFQPVIFKDSRGYFFESFRSSVFEDNHIHADFVQDNESLSCKDVVRGLHFQKPPWEQAKFIRVITGEILDVAVDIRKNSPTYGHHFALRLSGSGKKMFFIPAGFAHGFLTLTDNTLVQYKCTNYFNRESEMTLLWNDKDLNVKWGVASPIVSDKDKSGLPFHSFKTPF